MCVCLQSGEFLCISYEALSREIAGFSFFFFFLFLAYLGQKILEVEVIIHLELLKLPLQREWNKI